MRRATVVAIVSTKTPVRGPGRCRPSCPASPAGRQTPQNELVSGWEHDSAVRPGILPTNSEVRVISPFLCTAIALYKALGDRAEENLTCSTKRRREAMRSFCALRITVVFDNVSIDAMASSRPVRVRPGCAPRRRLSPTPKGHLHSRCGPRERTTVTRAGTGHGARALGSDECALRQAVARSASSISMAPLHPRRALSSRSLL